MREDERDPRLWAVVCDPAELVYVQRPTREEAAQVLEEQDRLIRYFGTPRLVAPIVVPLCVCDDGKGYVSTESGPRPVRCPAHPPVGAPA